MKDNDTEKLQMIVKYAIEHQDTKLMAKLERFLKEKRHSILELQKIHDYLQETLPDSGEYADLPKNT